jgi:hypothetical protein
LFSTTCTVAPPTTPFLSCFCIVARGCTHLPLPSSSLPTNRHSLLTCTILFRIRTSKHFASFVPLTPLKSARSPSPLVAKCFRIRTSVNCILKFFRIRTYEKKWGGGSAHSSTPTSPIRGRKASRDTMKSL